MSTRDDYTEHVMPNGAVCFYRDDDHSYFTGIEPKKKREPEGEWKGCGRLTGISTVSSPFDFNPENLMRWAAKTNGIGIAMLVGEALSADHDAETIRTQLAWLENDVTIWHALEASSLTFNDVREIAAERGTNVHKHSLYALAMGKSISDHEELTDDERGYAHGVEAFWLEHHPEPFQAEKVVMDTDLGVVGRFDLRCRLQAWCGRPRCPCRAVTVGKDMVMLDAKTSGFIPTKHHVQVAGYDWCAIQSGIGGSSAQWILQVDEHGGWELIPVRATAQDFMVAVDAYRRAGRINNAARADRKEREA